MSRTTPTPPVRCAALRSAALRCAPLCVLVAVLLIPSFGHARDDVDYIMETFPIVRKNDEKAHGEYRTKRVILEIYDEMAEAARSGKPYQTRLDPPPADPRVARPPRGNMEGAS